MARSLRIEFAGALYHVTARGNAQQDFFLDDEDRQRFLGVLARVVSRFHLLLHGYSLSDIGRAVGLHGSTISHIVIRREAGDARNPGQLSLTPFFVIHTHVLNRGGKGVRSPANALVQGLSHSQLQRNYADLYSTPSLPWG
jgi:hypothetical protein